MAKRIKTITNSEQVRKIKDFSLSHKKLVANFGLLALLVGSGLFIGKLFSSGKFITALIVLLVALIIMFLSLVFTIGLYDEDDDYEEDDEDGDMLPAAEVIPISVIENEIAKKKYKITQLDKKDKQQNKERLELLKEVKYWNALLEFWKNKEVE